MVDPPHRLGYTPCSVSSQNGHVAVVASLIEAKANLDSHDDMGRRPLSLAQNRNHTEIIRLLIKGKADVNFECLPAAFPLHEAVKRGNAAIVQLLVDARADLNARSSKKGSTTPLALAIAKGQTECGEVLIHAGCSFKETMADIKGPPPRWALECRAKLANCLLASRCVVRICHRRGLVHKDLIPVIGAMILDTQTDQRWLPENFDALIRRAEGPTIQSMTCPHCECVGTEVTSVCGACGLEFGVCPHCWEPGHEPGWEHCRMCDRPRFIKKEKE